MNKKMLVLTLLGAFWGGESMGNITMINTDCTKAFYIAATHLNISLSERMHSTMINESDSSIRIVFSYSAEVEGRGGGKQIVYTISKLNFKILKIEENLGR